MRMICLLAIVGVCACEAVEKDELEADQYRENQVKEAKLDYSKRMKEAYRVIDKDLPLGDYCKAVAEKAVPCKWNRYGDLDVPCLEDQALAENTCLEMGKAAREEMKNAERE